MAPAITELRTVSYYQSNNFIVLTLDKAETLYFLLSYLRKITSCRSSFAKIYFKRFPECLFSHRVFKLSSQSSSLLHLSFRFFLNSWLFTRAQALVFHSQRLFSSFGTVVKFVQSCSIFCVAIEHK